MFVSFALIPTQHKLRWFLQEACTLLASHYEGFAWLAKVAARVLLLLQLPSEASTKHAASEDSASAAATSECASADGIVRLAFPSSCRLKEREKSSPVEENTAPLG